jgi:hypothetical protein
MLQRLTHATYRRNPLAASPRNVASAGNSIQLWYQSFCVSRVANVSLTECLSEGLLLNVHTVQSSHNKRCYAATKTDPVRE